MILLNLITIAWSVVFEGNTKEERIVQTLDFLKKWKNTGYMCNWVSQVSLESLPLIHPVNCDHVLIISKTEYIYINIFVCVYLSVQCQLLRYEKTDEMVQEKKIKRMKWRSVVFLTNGKLHIYHLEGNLLVFISCPITSYTHLNNLL